jgi:hypothetical protein
MNLKPVIECLKQVELFRDIAEHSQQQLLAGDILFAAMNSATRSM